MKLKKILLVSVIAVMVLAFSIIAIGAGKNNDQTYIGTWKAQEPTGAAASLYSNSTVKLFVYPSHTGEWLNGSEYHNFTWNVDNGYMVVHYYSGVGETVYSFLSSDNGETMTLITDQIPGYGNYFAKYFDKVK